MLFKGGVGLKRKLGTAAFFLAIFATTTISQFTSTLLLSDLKYGLVPGDIDTIEMPGSLSCFANATYWVIIDQGFYQTGVLSDVCRIATWSLGCGRWGK